MLATADDVGEPGPDRTFGAGVLDLASATEGLAQPTSGSPGATAVPTIPASAAPASSTAAPAPTGDDPPATSGPPSLEPPVTAPLPNAPGETTAAPQPFSPVKRERCGGRVGRNLDATRPALAARSGPGVLPLGPGQ